MLLSDCRMLLSLSGVGRTPTLDCSLENLEVLLCAQQVSCDCTLEYFTYLEVPKGHVIRHRSEIIYYLIWPIYPCVSIALPVMSTVCTWGKRVFFFLVHGNISLCFRLCCCAVVRDMWSFSYYRTYSTTPLFS